MPTKGITPPHATPAGGTGPAASGTIAPQVTSAPLGGQIPASGAIPAGMALTPGITLGDAGRYEIVRALGKGGMGSIFLAYDTRVNNKPVVIKQMLPNYSTEEERIEAEDSFQEEMKTLAAMSHP
ncbi:MAG TPA: hypothetical protein VGP33_01795, partial [Chloroflexota bacterium]|nr:hypothetical protein [Chloroflexota bacterium]